MVCVLSPLSSSAQEPVTAPSVQQTPAAPAAASSAEPEVSWRKLPANLLHDQKEIWLFPTQVARGRHWLPTALVVGGTAALIATDPQTMAKFRRTDNFHDYNRIFSGRSTGATVAAVPAAFYVIGLIRKNSYDQSTALYAGEAVANDFALMVALKAITHRARPNEIEPTGKYSDTFFASKNSLIGKGTSFPSGHAMMSFSVATVFARRYRQHRWVPYVAYGLAAAFSFSRVTNGTHFPSDVFLGAALGYSIARFDVLREH
jgi:membrane-associated phospholipid phosphatase